MGGEVQKHHLTQNVKNTSEELGVNVPVTSSALTEDPATPQHSSCVEQQPEQLIKYKTHFYKLLGVERTSIMLWFSTWEFFSLSMRMSFCTGTFEDKVQSQHNSDSWSFSSSLWWTNLWDFSVSQRQHDQGFLEFGLWTFQIFNAQFRLVNVESFPDLFLPSAQRWPSSVCWCSLQNTSFQRRVFHSVQNPSSGLVF